MCKQKFWILYICGHRQRRTTDPCGQSPDFLGGSGSLACGMAASTQEITISSVMECTACRAGEQWEAVRRWCALDRFLGMYMLLPHFVFSGDLEAD